MAASRQRAAAVLSAHAKAGNTAAIDALIADPRLSMTPSMWNAVISGLAGGRKRGRYDVCMQYFAAMVKSGTRPDAMTFSSLIGASRDGSVDIVARGQRLLTMMQVCTCTCIDKQHTAMQSVTIS